MTPIEELLAIEEIKRLKSRYFLCTDNKDWAGLIQLFAHDGVLDISEAFLARDRNGHIIDNGLHGDNPPLFPVATGPAEIAALVESGLGTALSIHQGFMPDISIVSDASARGVWAMEDHHRFPPGSVPQTLHGWGHYRDEYVHISGVWLIQSTRLTRLRVDLA